MHSGVPESTASHRQLTHVVCLGVLCRLEDAHARHVGSQQVGREGAEAGGQRARVANVTGLRIHSKGVGPGRLSSWNAAATAITVHSKGVSGFSEFLERCCFTLTS